MGFAFDAFLRPWERSGVGMRLDAVTSGAIMLAEGARYTSVLVTAGYGYHWPAARSGITGSSIDFLFGPAFGGANRSWAEGLCLDFDGGGCQSSRPADFRPYQRLVTAVSAAVTPSLHVWHLVFGVYGSGAAGLSGNEAFWLLQAGVRLGLSDM